VAKPKDLNQKEQTFLRYRMFMVYKMQPMKRQICYSLVTSLIFVLPACQSPETRAVNQNKSGDTTMNNSTATTGSKELNQDQKESSGKDEHNYFFHTKISDDDHMFLDDVKTMGMMEITLATVAQKSTDPKIRDYANMMITDHRLMDKEVEKLASAAKIILRVDYDAKEQEELKMMRGLTGPEFDKHYKEMMVKDHAKAIEMFKNGSDTREEVVKEFANKSLGVIQSHYEAAKKL
jgi:putative membrane protein